MNTPGQYTEKRETNVEVYILKCADESYFIGHTRDMLKTLQGHMAGKIDSYTSTRLPIKLEYIATFESLDDALAFKKQLQGWSRSKKAAFIAEGFEGVQRLRREEKSIRGLVDAKM